MFSMTLNAQEAIFLKKNNVAPYAGILAPKSYIVDLEHKADLAKMYKDTLDHNTDCLPELPGIAPPSVGFWEGTAVGGAVIFLLEIIFHH